MEDASAMLDMVAMQRLLVLGAFLAETLPSRKGLAIISAPFVL